MQKEQKLEQELKRYKEHSKKQQSILEAAKNDLEHKEGERLAEGESSLQTPD
jgi:GTPase involved in cell partitioning and DNA repair